MTHQQFFNQLAAVFLVENGKAGAEAQGFDLGANNGQAKVVEGGDCEAFAVFFAQQTGNSGFHLPGGFVGEGDRGYIAGRDATVFDQIGNLFGDYAGFTAAGTGQH